MSIFPFGVDSNEEEEKLEELPPYKEYAYDFEQNELKLDKNGNTYLVERNEALKIWIYKALNTERFYYTAYSEDFGSEHKEQLTGHVIDSEVLKLELERFIIEALMINSYILELDNFTFNKSGTDLEVSFDCKTVYGTETVSMQHGGVN